MPCLWHHAISCHHTKKNWCQNYTRRKLGKQRHLPIEGWQTQLAHDEPSHGFGFHHHERTLVSSHWTYQRSKSNLSTYSTIRRTNQTPDLNSKETPCSTTHLLKHARNPMTWWTHTKLLHTSTASQTAYPTMSKYLFNRNIHIQTTRLSSSHVSQTLT